MALSFTACRILFVDAFDSFSNNIIGALEQQLNAHVTTVHIDDDNVSRHLEVYLKQFDAVVVGPGPGHPANLADTGFIYRLWHLKDENLLPIFGICLGFQSLCLSQGASVDRLKSPRHGIVTEISHQNTDIWTGVGICHATQYHSLRANLEPGRSTDTQRSNDATWTPSEHCPTLLPLAWDMSDPADGPILQSVRHVTKPFWGVQFHPESVCTSAPGRNLITNWWVAAQAWISSPSHMDVPVLEAHVEDTPLVQSPVLEPSILPEHQTPWIPTVDDGKDLATSETHLNDKIAPHSVLGTHHSLDFHRNLQFIVGHTGVSLHWCEIAAGRIDPVLLMEALGRSKDEMLLLDAQDHPSGRYSIVGLVDIACDFRITYRSSDKSFRYGKLEESASTTRVKSIEDVWTILQEAADSCRPRHSYTTTGDAEISTDFPHHSPFWGGFMGYISYEAGLETIDVRLHPSCGDGASPDVSFAFISRSIVIDHDNSRVYVQSIRPKDSRWVSAMALAISNWDFPEHGIGAKPALSEAEAACLNAALQSAKISRPTEPSYRDKVLTMQSYLRSGDSYELCLTDQTEIHATDAPIDEWALYKRLRINNPAPFGAFMRLSGAILVGTSPERFLSWSRSGHCQFRPIKGTVKKSPEMTRKRAEEILGSSKEQAENLMIVDLIRHDLSGVVGAHNTKVTKLMVVEEYEHVYQLVSVIEGQTPEGKTGIDVLKASLPPGSMTGAPKKRSCEIIRDVEKRPRGLYSGVLGYIDVGGGGDFSVVIRSLVKAAGTVYWYNGAGGAVTIQSTDEGEYLEMEAKNLSVLGAIFKET